jgi:hypothetical protein
VFAAVSLYPDGRFEARLCRARQWEDVESDRSAPLLFADIQQKLAGDLARFEKPVRLAGLGERHDGFNWHAQAAIGQISENRFIPRRHPGDPGLACRNSKPASDVER